MTSRFKAFCPLILLACTAALGVGTEQQLQRKFQEAVQLYDSNRLDEAAVRLQQLVRESPQSFDVHELLGMVYSAQGKDAEATEYLQSAVRLKPNSSAARTNLAANLVRVHKLAPAEIEFKKALALDPASYDTNHNLGEFYIASERSDRRFLSSARLIDSSRTRMTTLTISHLPVWKRGSTPRRSAWSKI